MDLWSLVILPLGLGLVGFLEPCTVGSSLLLVQYLEGKDAAGKVQEMVIFTGMRVLVLGLLGAAAGLIGSATLDLQHGFWIVLGVVYVGLGALYLGNRQSALMRTLGPELARRRKGWPAAALGLVFGLNVPACAAPLLGAMFAMSIGLASAAQGFTAMAVFGLGLSLPLVLAVSSGRARDWLDRLARVSARAPRWTGAIFIVLGMSSIYMGVRT